LFANLRVNAGNLHGGVCEGGDIPVVPWWT